MSCSMCCLFARIAGAPGMLLGLCMTANCCGEVPVYLFSGWWLPRLGVQRALNLVLLGYVLRLGAYTVRCLLVTLPILSTDSPHMPYAASCLLHQFHSPAG
jgi:hypothetical protein